MCQQFVEDAVKSATFFDLQLSQGSVATYCMYDRNLYSAYIENFSMNQLVKKFRKSVHICQVIIKRQGIGYSFLDTM